MKGRGIRRSAQRKHCFVSFRDPSRNHIAPIPIFPSFYCDCGRSAVDFRTPLRHRFVFYPREFFHRTYVDSIDPHNLWCFHWTSFCCFFLFFLFQEKNERTGERGSKRMRFVTLNDSRSDSRLFVQLRFF